MTDTGCGQEHATRITITSFLGAGDLTPGTGGTPCPRPIGRWGALEERQAMVATAKMTITQMVVNRNPANIYAIAIPGARDNLRLSTASFP